jgi:hypothetical protein
MVQEMDRKEVVMRSRLVSLVLVAVAAGWGLVLVPTLSLEAQEQDPVSAEAGQVEQEAPATTLADWKQRHQQLGASPEGAIKLWFDAVFLACDPETRDLGREVLQYLTVPFKDDPQWYRRPSASTFASRLEDPRHHHIFRSYVKGATPENGYTIDRTGYSLHIAGSERDQYGRGWKLLLASSGADSPRPVYLRQSTKSGLWFVDSFANVYVGVRAPQSPDEERFQ